MTEVKLEGVNEVNQALSIAGAKVHEILVKTVEEVCKEAAFEAKGIITEMGAVDTGALRHSITGDVVRVDSAQVEGQVGAGRAEVRRGEGDFEFSKKTGLRRDIQATSEYAESVEFRGAHMVPPRPFMGVTYVWLKYSFPKRITQALTAAIRRIGR